MGEKVRKAMVLAAGLGTRLGEVTRSRPKALVEVHGVPLLEIVLGRLRRAGYRRVVVNLHHHAAMIRDHLRHHPPGGMEILLSEERERPLETGGGVRRARPLLQDAGTILLHNVDILTDLDLQELTRRHEAAGALVTLAVLPRTTTRYLLADETGQLCGWENLRTDQRRRVREPRGELHRYGYSGIAVLDRSALDLLPDEEVFSLTPFFLDLAARHRVQVAPLPVTYWYDVGKPGIVAIVEQERTKEEVL